MNEALNSIYNDLKNSGFKGTPEQFKNLMMTDSEARNQVYNDLKSSGFAGTQDQFHELIGFGQQPAPQVKKKADMVSPSAATSSVSPLGKPTNAFQERLQADRLGREVSMRPVETAAPKQALSVGGAVKPETPEQIIEKAKPQPQDVYLNKALSTINEDLVGSNEEYVVPKLNYQFGDYGFNFEEAGPMRDRIKVTAPNGKVEEFSLDNFLSSSDQGVASELQKFISNNQVASKAIEARAKSLESSKFSEDKDVTNAINGLNTETNSFKKELDAFVLAQKQLEEESNIFIGMDANEIAANKPLYDQYVQKSKLLEAKKLDIIKKEKELSYRSNKLTSDIGAYTMMKSKQGTWYEAGYNALVSDIDEIASGISRAYLSFKDATVGLNARDKAELLLWKNPENSEIAQKTFGSSTTTKEYLDEINKTFVGGALIGALKTIPLAASGAVATPLLIAQASNDVYKELDDPNDPLSQNMPEWKKGAYALTIGTIVGELEKLGFSNVISEKFLLNTVVNGVLKKAGKNLTGKAFKDFVSQEVESLAVRGLLRVGAAGLAEAEQGAGEEAASSLMKIAYNALEGKEIFKTPEDTLDFFKQVLVAGAQEGIGGAAMGTLSASSKAYSENKFDKMLDNQVKLMSAIKDDPTYVDAFNAKMNQDAVNGIITEEEAEKNKNNLQQSMGLFKQIPDNISTEGQKKALGLLIERKKLEDARQGKDPDLVIKETNRINEIKQELQKISEDYAIQESSTEESVLRTEQPEMGLQEVGEGNTQVEATPQEVVAQEEVTPAEPLEQRSSKLLDAISKARELGAEGIGVLNESISKLKSIADERINQIGNKIDDLKQKSRDLISSGTIQASKLSDLVGSKVNYDGEEGVLNISEGGAVTIETPNQVIDIENATPDALAADFKISTPKPSVAINPDSDKYIDNDNVTINNIDYGINTDDNGNVVGLVVNDGSGQVLSNPELLKKAEIIRNTEGKVSNQIETTLDTDTQSKVDELNNQISALENERSAIQKEISGPAETQATPAEKRFAGNVLASTRIVAEDLAKLVSILTKANKNINVIVDKQKMIDFLIKKGLSPEQAAQVKGFRIGDRVFINPDLATVDTPIHEFAHVWGELCKKQRPELWKRGMSLITKSNYYKDLVARIKDNPELAKLYSSPNAIKEEALIQAIGERGAVIFDDNKLQLMWNNWVKTFDAFIKKVLGLPMETDITKIKLSEFLDMAATEVLTGKSTGVGGEMTIEKTKAAKNIEAQVEAWHGSPYRFDKFSLSKMGTGEGAQAFGWGLYFTDLKDVGKIYAKNLTAKAKYSFEGIGGINDLKKDPRRFNIMTASFVMDMLKSNPQNRQDAVNWVRRNSRGKSERVLRELFELADALDIDNSVRQNLYKVSLHEGKTPDQYTWLEWDKPLDKQRANELISKLTESQREQGFGYGLSGINTEGEFYRKLANALGGNLRGGDKQASLFLLENGIDGIKYPAESISRGATSDTARGFNYVVFDENAVKIQEAIQFQAQQSVNDLAKIINDAIKAKLSKAQIVDILVKRGGLTDAEANQAYNDVKSGNAISFTTTGTTPAATTTTVKPGAKYIAAISDAINNLAGGNLSPEVKDSIIKSIKDARTAIKNTLAAERAIRKEVASAVNDLVSKGDLTQKQAAAILKRFASVDMFNDTSIDKFITNTFSVFERSANKAIANKRNSLLSSIKSLVAKSAKQPKTSTGKARSGSLDSQGQSFFKAVKEILTAALNNDINKMSELAAELSNQQEINDAIDKEIRGEKLTTKEAELLDKVYAFDTFGDILNMSEQELETFLDDFKTAKASSIVQLKRQRAEWVAERKLLHEKAAMSVKDNAPNLYDNGRLMNDNEIIAKKREIWQSFQKMHVWEGLKKVYDNMDLFGINFVGRWLRKSLSNLETLLLTIESNGNKFFTDNILQPLKDFYEVHQRGIHDQYDKLSEIANTIPGIKGGYKEIKKLLSKGVVTIKMMDGKNSAFNADELLSIYCLSKNDVQREKLLKSGIGPIQLAEIKGILGDKVIQFGDKVVDYLSNEYYESVNDIYSNVNYTNLPKVENYFPTKSLSPSASAQALYSGDFSSIFNSETASALKERTDDSSPIQLHRAFTDVMSSHIDTMERYKAYAEGTKRINAIFESKDFNTLMEVTGTKKMIRYLTNLSINPNINIPSGETGFSKLLDKFSGFALAFKLAQLPKQATSFINAFEDYQFSKKRKIAPLDLLMFGLENAYTIATLPKQIAKAYNMSAGFKSRIDQALEGGFHKIESGARVSSATKKLRSDSKYEKGKKILRVIAQSPTVLGDIMGIMGYMTNYNRDIANGMSEEDALKKFNEYNVTAQTKRDVDKIPLQQSEHGLNRVFTMFGSTGWLQLNKVMQSATNVRRASFNYAKTRNSKDLPNAKDVRALLLNLGVANMLFAAVSNLAKFIGGDDEDREKALAEMKKAMLGLNILYQIPLIGDAAETMVNAINGDPMPRTGTINPLLTVFYKAYKGIKEDDYLKVVQPIFEIAAGAQADPFIGLYKYFSTDNTKEETDAMYDMLGIAKSYRPEENTGGKILKEEPTEKELKELKEYDPDTYQFLYGEGTDYKIQKDEEKALKKEEKENKETFNNY